MHLMHVLFILMDILFLWYLVDYFFCVRSLTFEAFLFVCVFCCLGGINDALCHFVYCSIFVCGLVL